MIEHDAPHIWVPRIKILEPNREIALCSGLRGFYKLEAVNLSDGRRRLLADWFPNLVTDAGLEFLGNGNGAYMNFCSVGTGNTAPNNSNTTLASYLASTASIQASTQTNPGSAPWYGAQTTTYRFNAGVATGNLAEVGVGPASNGTNLFSRALILDGGGSPTTITVLSTEALDVTYQLRDYAPTADVTGSITVSGTSYNFTARASRANATSWAPFNEIGGFFAVSPLQGALSALITGSPSGTSGAGGAVTNAGYSAGSHQITASAFWDLNNGNIAGGINCFECFMGRGGSRFGSTQIQLSASIPKDASHTLTMNFTHTWGRGP